MRTGEQEIAIAIMRIADAQPNSTATFDRIRTRLPGIVNLTQDDWVESQTRPGEPLWHQIIRNIRSHHAAEGNFIDSGYLEHIPRVGYKIPNLPPYRSPSP